MKRSEFKNLIKEAIRETVSEDFNMSSADTATFKGNQQQSDRFLRALSDKGIKAEKVDFKNDTLTIQHYGGKSQLYNKIVPLAQKSQT